VLDFSAPQGHNQNKSWGDMVVMDLFAELDQKLDVILSKVESYKQAIAELKEALAAKDQALAAKDRSLKEAEAALEQITREKEMVRQRIDKILNRLKILDLGEAT
jgi:chromosome segregation ATPase